jgi:hypothetical protein
MTDFPADAATLVAGLERMMVLLCGSFTALVAQGAAGVLE